MNKPVSTLGLLKEHMGPVYIYGAGELARLALRIIADSGYDLDIRFMVTTAPPEIKHRDGYAVHWVEEVCFPANSLVLIAVDRRYHLEITDTLHSKGVTNILPLTSESFQPDITDFLMGYFEKYAIPYSCTPSPFAPLEWNLVALFDSDKPLESVPHFRMRTADVSDWDNALEFLRNTDLTTYYADMFGPYRTVDMALGGISSDGNAEPFIASAVSGFDLPLKIVPPPNRYIHPLHVGACLCSERKAEITDDTGEHISPMNVYLCEMTAAYWLWKNCDAPYVGLYHYRRHFDISEAKLRRLNLSDVDIIAVTPSIMTPDFLSYYVKSGYVAAQVADILLDVLKNDVCAAAAQRVFSGHMGHSYNMCIMKKQWYDRYASWLFPVLFAVHDKVQAAGLDKRRYLGYVSEMLLSVFLSYCKDEARIAYAEYYVFA